METGSIVETKSNFEQARKDWGFNYPRRGDVLTVRAITQHPNAEIRKLGIVQLHFEELPSVPGICDKTIHGHVNFEELTLPDEIEELLKESPEKELLTINN